MLFRGTPFVWALGLAALTMMPSGAVAQASTSASHFAVTDARLVTVSGRTIENGTIVVRDGIITDLGDGARVPADAWVIDGSGLTVYPGLIDALSTLGMSREDAPPAATGSTFGGGGGPPGQGGGGGSPPSVGPEDRPATYTWRMAADRLTPDQDAFGRWRSAVFTTVVTGPARGFFPGNTAVVNLGDERPNSMVVMTPVAQRFNLSGGPGHRGFPNSLAGAFAYGKQFLSDAGYYRRAKELYEANPRGRERPTYDRALEGILPVQAGDEPLLFPASTATEIRRALRTSDEMGVRPIVYGAGAGYGVAGELSRSAVPVLVSLDWPEAPANPDPTQDVPLEELRHRLLAPTTPARFQEAGVRFAFYSDGGSASDAIAGARVAVEAGLSHDQAVRALTLSAAEIFEVDDRIGSLEVGKIANLTITDGDLLDEEVSVRMVFVDGQQFEFDGSSDERTGARAGRNGNGPRDADDEGASNSGPSATELRSRIGLSHRVAYRDDAVTVIQNATILTITNGTIENGSILIRNGKIAEVGTDVSVPRGARVVDAAGQYVMPGIIDAHTHIGGGFNEGSVNVSAMTGVHDVINPDDVNIYRALAGGVTSVNVLHGSANPIGGQNAVLKLRWGSDADGLVMQGAPPGIKFALGENPKRGGGWPATRMGVNDVIRQAFVEAEQYQADWDAYRAGGDDGIPPRRDLELEALAEILSGERLVHAHAYRQDEILQLIRLAEEFGFRVATFQHVLEGYKVAKEIAEHGAAASTFSDWWGYKMEAYDAIPYNAAIMVEKGVSVSINSDSNEEMRHLNQEAAKTMKWGGMTETQALSMITINPARQLGVADQVGSIEVGKDADIVIFDRHPLDNFSIPQKTYVDGKLYFDIEGDRERQRAIDDEKEALTSETGGRRVTTDAPDVEPSREGGVR